MKPKILLTGSCSFLLSNFIRKCTYEKVDYTFCSIDKTNSQTIHSLYFNKNHTFYVADILDPHILDVIFKTEKPDIVIHGAALTSRIDSYTKTSEFLETNVVGTQNVIKASVDHGVSKFIYLSTSQVYGETEGANELTPVNPQNPYALSKSMGEKLVLQANRQFKLPYIITRATEVYGQRQTSDKLIPEFIRDALREKFISSINGEEKKDWLYVGDHSLAILALLRSDTKNEIFNISSKEEFTISEIVKQLTELIQQEDLLVLNKENLSHKDVAYNLVNANKFSYLFKPSVKIKDGLAATLEWYKNNLWWFKDDLMHEKNS